MSNIGEGKVIKDLGGGSWLLKVRTAEIIAQDNSVPRLKLKEEDLVLVVAFDSFQKGARIIGLAGMSEGDSPDLKGGKFDESHFDGEEVFEK